MPIAFDANLGSATGVGGVSSLNITTTGAAAANAFIVVWVSWFNNTTALVTGVSVAGTACASARRTTNGQDLLDIWTCSRSATTPTSSTVTVTWANTGTGGTLVGIASFTGVTTGAVLAANGATGTGASWSSGAVTNTGAADALLIGGSGNEDITNPTTSTASSGTEIHDLYASGPQQGLVTGYKILSAIASDSIAGTFSNANSTSNTGAVAVFAADVTGAAASPGPRTFNAIPFIGGGL